MCTALTIKHPKGAVMARTMDYEVPLEYGAIYIPRGYNYANDLMGNKLTNKYNMLGMAFHNRLPIKDGLNEHGLVGTTNLFLSMNVFEDQVDSSKFNITSLDYMNYALGNYKTCQELVDDLPNIHISTKDSEGKKAISPEFHYYFIDNEGASFVIEPHKQKLVAYENPYMVMTNSPAFPKHVKRLEKLISHEKFKASKDLPGGYDPVSRFIKAHIMATRHIDCKDSNEAFAAAINALETVSIPKGPIPNDSYNFYTSTRYRSAFDTDEKTMLVRTETNHQYYSFSIDDMKDFKDMIYIEIPDVMESKRLIDTI